MKIGIIGTGAYAIALASVLENKNVNIMMWTALKNEYDELIKTKQNLKASKYKLSDSVTFTMNMDEIVKENDTLILAIPAKFIESTVDIMKKSFTNQNILIATKGIGTKNQELIHEYLNDVKIISKRDLSGRDRMIFIFKNVDILEEDCE